MSLVPILLFRPAVMASAQAAQIPEAARSAVHFHTLVFKRSAASADLLVSAAQGVHFVVMLARREVLQLAQEFIIPKTAHQLPVARLSLCADWLGLCFLVAQCRDETDVATGIPNNPDALSTTLGSLSVINLTSAPASRGLAPGLHHALGRSASRLGTQHGHLRKAPGKSGNSGALAGTASRDGLRSG